MKNERLELIAKFHQYSLERNRSKNISKGFYIDGSFSSHKDSENISLFGMLDFAYSYYTFGILDDSLTIDNRVLWILKILEYQNEEGWFVSNDEQKHSVEHSTAYALGAIQILSSTLEEEYLDNIFKNIKPFKGLDDKIEKGQNVSGPPIKLSKLDEIHFWRGSHRIAGIPAIIGIISDLFNGKSKLIGIDSPKEWLKQWALYYKSRIDESTGYWVLAPASVQLIFDMVYKYRHDPLLAKMGGAVHLYWIFNKLDIKPKYSKTLVKVTSSLQRPTGLFENKPYCIDLDGVYILSYALSMSDLDDETVISAKNVLFKNREAIVKWLLENNWSDNSHRLPGALAAIAQTDEVLNDSDIKFQSPLSLTWWL